ncbi:MAG: hypothetical protein K2Y18_03335 [Alphaproteobacteria bacterium]|jgi:hypothetical protein|nr:hypothetical protein [Alphaproteobacteria bacterium]
MYQCFVVMIVGLLLGACGKKGPLEQLESSEYPRTYPKPPSPDTFPVNNLLKKQNIKDCCNE